MMRKLQNKATASITLASLTWVILGNSSLLNAAPISFNTALPVAKNAFLNREQFVFRRFKSDSSPLNRNLEVNGLISVLGIGVTTKLALFGALPYFDKTLNLDINGQTISRETNNVGDMRWFARYTFLQKDEPSKTLRVAAFGGIKAPTGDDTAIDSLGTLPIPLQTGTGSWDYFAGTVITYQVLDYQIDAQLRADQKSKANNVKLGDEFRADISLQYRISPLNNDTHSFLYAVLESNLIYQKRTRISGITDFNDPNSGAITLFITPGIQYVTVKYILEAGIQIPVTQKLHGNALETDYLFTTGFRINF